jgi:hypothetical protein
MAAHPLEESLPTAWTRPRTNARLHILRAHGAPKAVIIRRKPSKVFHIILWDTITDELEFGSWFHGRIYSQVCDLSWDGEWMVYVAMGRGFDTWTGICRPPRLKTVADVTHAGTWAEGGFFRDAGTLHSNDLRSCDHSLSEVKMSDKVPFAIERMDPGSEAFPILSHRLHRDGWKRVGEFGALEGITLKSQSSATLCLDDPGWSWQPTPEHPILRMFYRGYLLGGHTFEFQLEGSNILDPDVDWATWDSKGDLLTAKKGAVYRYSLAALKNGTPDFSMDLEHLAPPAKATP